MPEARLLAESLQFHAFAVPSSAGCLASLCLHFPSAQWKWLWWYWTAGFSINTRYTSKIITTILWRILQGWVWSIRAGGTIILTQCMQSYNHYIVSSTWFYRWTSPQLRRCWGLNSVLELARLGSYTFARFPAQHLNVLCFILEVDLLRFSLFGSWEKELSWSTFTFLESIPVCDLVSSTKL